MSDFFIILAEAPQQVNGLMKFLGQFGPFILIGVMIFLLFRAQKKHQEQEKTKKQQMLDAIKSGDKVVTVGGIYGEIAGVKEDSLVLKIADKVKIDINKQAVSSVINNDKQEKDLSNK